MEIILFTSPIERRRHSVTSHYHGSKINFWITTKGSLGNNDGDSNENSKKNNKFIVYIFFVSKLRYSPFGFNPEHFANI